MISVCPRGALKLEHLFMSQTNHFISLSTMLMNAVPQVDGNEITQVTFYL